jgi:hypothetical protein
MTQDWVLCLIDVYKMMSKASETNMERLERTFPVTHCCFAAGFLVFSRPEGMHSSRRIGHCVEAGSFERVQLAHAGSYIGFAVLIAEFAGTTFMLLSILTVESNHKYTMT